MTHRRGNGLLADAYVPLILLAPSHADVMLEALRRSGIAAYAVPLDDDVLEPPGGDSGDLPTDHLYVDAEERPAAERVLGSELPELNGDGEPVSDLLAPRSESRPETDGDGGENGADQPPVGGDLLDGPPVNVDPDAEPATPSDEDEVWNDLVARFYDDGAETATERRGAAWPDAENLSTPEERDSPTVLGDILGRSRRGHDADTDDPKDQEARAAREDRENEESAAEAARQRAEEELEGHYEPPPPPPLLQGDRLGIAAWCGLLSGPVVLFGAAFLDITLPNWMMLLLVLAFLSSFVVLVLRMTDSRPPGDSGPDNGAVV